MTCARLLLASVLLALPGVGVAADLLQDCEHCPLMVRVESGSFPRAAGMDDPPVEVSIGHAYALGRCEVTVGEFRQFAEATGFRSQGCQLYGTAGDREYPEGGWNDPGFRQRDNRPVVCVSWENATAYAAWLSEQTGEVYRLPSEAEWEFAARAGAGHESSWYITGNLRAGQAKCATCFGSDVMGREDDLATVSVGGSFRNAFGLADMLGNVAEWTADCSAPMSDAPIEGSAMQGGDCGQRLTRGGAFHSDWAILARYRVPLPAGQVRNDVGFRVLRELPTENSDPGFARYADSGFTTACQ